MVVIECEGRDRTQLSEVTEDALPLATNVMAQSVLQVVVIWVRRVVVTGHDVILVIFLFNFALIPVLVPEPVPAPVLVLVLVR